MSIAFLLNSHDEAVVWRGPKKTGKDIPSLICHPITQKCEMLKVVLCHVNKCYVMSINVPLKLDLCKIHSCLFNEKSLLNLSFCVSMFQP